MMHTPTMFLFPLAGFLIISSLVLLSIWFFKHTEKKTQLKWIIFLLILGIVAGTSGTLLRIKAMKDSDGNMRFTHEQIKEMRDITPFMDRDTKFKKMMGSGSMMQGY